MSALEDIGGLVERHRVHRARTLNLIASENVPHPAVQEALAPALDHRYGDYLGGSEGRRKYRGQPFMAQIEVLVAAEVAAAFGAEWADLRPLGGHLAGVAVLLGVCRPGDLVLELDGAAGGHRTAEKLAQTPLIDLEVQAVPWDGGRMCVDAGRLERLVRERRPRVVILGSSCCLFADPSPLAVEGCVTVYDASHVAGLIVAGLFPNPLERGIDLLVASTHKTLGGPQGGMVLGSFGPMECVRDAIYPALVTNHHSARIPAVGAAVARLRSAEGRAEAALVVDCARKLAEMLDAVGCGVVVRDGESFTDTHTVAVLHPEPERASARLEAAGILASTCGLPPEWGGGGLRLGTQELVRRGMGPSDMRLVADLIVRALNEADPGVAHEVVELALAFQEPTA